MTLTQRRRLFGNETFTLLEDKIVIRIRGLGRSVEYAMPYTHLAPDPTRVRQIGFAWFAISILSLGLSLLFLILGAHQRRSDDAGLFYFWMVASGVVFLVTLIGGIRKSFDVTVFPAANGRVVFRTNRPTTQECREFVRCLQEKVNDSRSIERRIVENVLRVLHAEDFLDEWKYRKARERFNVRSSEASGPE